MKYPALILVLLLSSCATYRNANNDGYSVVSGGYTDTKIDEGIYKINVESGVSPVAHKSSVTKIWNRRAKDLCLGTYNDSDFEVAVIDQGFTYMSQGNIGYFVTRASGYAICSSFSGNYDQALDIIKAPVKLIALQHKIDKEILMSQVESGCDASAMDIDTLEKSAMNFIKQSSTKKQWPVF
jgi:hypothetical protein